MSKMLSSPVWIYNWPGRRGVARHDQSQKTTPLEATLSVKKRSEVPLPMLSENAPMLARLWCIRRNSSCCHAATCYYILLPGPFDYHSLTMILEKVSDISLGVGPKCVSGRVETPAAILSSIIFNITWGTPSSVARIVRRTICCTSQFCWSRWCAHRLWGSLTCVL